MKIAGIVLLVLQVLALIGGGFPAGNIAFMLGFFAPGIIGVILLVKAGKKKAKQQEENDNQ